MKKSRQELLQKTIKIAKPQQLMLNELMDKHGFISESEVFRHALTYFYKKREPAYLQPSPYMKEKAEEQTKREEFNSLSGEQYVKEYLPGAVILKNDKNETFVVTMGKGNNLYVDEIDVVKQKFTQEPWFLKTHVDQVNSGSKVSDRIEYSQFLLDEHGLTFTANDEDQNK